MAEDSSTALALANLGDERRRQAMDRFAVLRLHLEDGVPLTRAAADSGIPLRTAQHWLACYRESGLTGLARPVRRDAGGRRAPPPSSSR